MMQKNIKKNPIKISDLLRAQSETGKGSRTRLLEMIAAIELKATKDSNLIWKYPTGDNSYYFIASHYAIGEGSRRELRAEVILLDCDEKRRASTLVESEQLQKEGYDTLGGVKLADTAKTQKLNAYVLEKLGARIFAKMDSAIKAHKTDVKRKKEYAEYERERQARNNWTNGVNAELAKLSLPKLQCRFARVPSGQFLQYMYGCTNPKSPALNKQCLVEARREYAGHKNDPKQVAYWSFYQHCEFFKGYSSEEIAKQEQAEKAGREAMWEALKKGQIRFR